MLGRVWITDRGMASAQNLAWLRQTGRRYIIGALKSELKKFGFELARPEGWRTVQDGVEVKLARHPETDKTVVLCAASLMASRWQIAGSGLFLFEPHSVTTTRRKYFLAIFSEKMTCNFNLCY
jgi:hypothetical protein